MTTAAITAAAMKLSERQKTRLAEKLVASLAPEPKIWEDDELVQEVNCRIAELDSGKVKPIPYETVMRQLKRKPQR